MIALTLVGCLFISNREVADRIRVDDRPHLDDSGDAHDSDARCDIDQDGERSVSCGGLDCEDDDPAVNTDAEEACNGIDDNCDGSTDEDGGAEEPLWHPDADGDTYGDAGSATHTCTPRHGLVEDGQDCDDGDDGVHPGAEEVCNEMDDDCDSVIDEEGATGAPTWYADVDEDGHGDRHSTSVSCEQPDGYGMSTDDCDDLDPSVYAGADEACDGLDNDCNTVIDDTSICPCTVQHSADAHAYLVCGAQKDWPGAQGYCADYGYTLVTVDDLTENELLLVFLLDYRAATWWIGVNDRATEGVYEWDDGSAYSYSNWYSTSDVDETSDCGMIAQGESPGGQWQTADCARTADFICEAG